MNNFDKIKEMKLKDILQILGFSEFEEEGQQRAFLNIFQLINCRYCPAQKQCSNGECCQKTQMEWLKKEYDHETEQKSEEYVANYLLEGGAIHVPCKVGDVVYRTDGVNIYESEVCEISLSKRAVIYYTENAVAFDETALGKSIFLTKEEAERRLTK